MEQNPGCDPPNSTSVNVPGSLSIDRHKAARHSAGERSKVWLPPEQGQVNCEGAMCLQRKMQALISFA